MTEVRISKEMNILVSKLTNGQVSIDAMMLSPVRSSPDSFVSTLIVVTPEVAIKLAKEITKAATGVRV